ncbi:unnamed protein product [Pleuronectes platessa]|uniref:Uncharacterized protein n=1 Tax=Pleuronectes platessa TaxID=8262 RepID=A0A9N7UW36_PLEPL|nr:unnamed protein product [Pleuronectes platessa]
MCDSISDRKPGSRSGDKDLERTRDNVETQTYPPHHHHHQHNPRRANTFEYVEPPGKRGLWTPYFTFDLMLLDEPLMTLRQLRLLFPQLPGPSVNGAACLKCEGKARTACERLCN